MKVLRPLLGLMVLAMVAAVVWFVQRERGTGPASREDSTTVSLWAGGEKSRFLRNPEVTRILAERHGLNLDAVKAGSIEMVTTLSLDGRNAVWPSTQVAAELYRRRGGVLVTEETVFQSPLVVFTWAEVADALIAKGWVEARGETLFLTGFAPLVEALEQETPWSALSLPQLYGAVRIGSTDPRRSNSGNMFAGLLAVMLDGGRVPTVGSVEALVPRLRSYFERLGYMESSSGDIFESFLKTGMGARPLVVGYENQLTEYVVEHRDQAAAIAERIRVLYPVPTVWASHPLIALDATGVRLVEALRDPEIQALAWKEHGFRSGVAGVDVDPQVLPVRGVPVQVTAVVPLPSAEVMEKIMQGLE